MDEWGEKKLGKCLVLVPILVFIISGCILFYYRVPFGYDPSFDNIGYLGIMVYLTAVSISVTVGIWFIATLIHNIYITIYEYCRKKI